MNVYFHGLPAGVAPCGPDSGETDRDMGGRAKG